VVILLLLLLLLLLPAVMSHVTRPSAKALKAASSDDSTAAETPYQEQRPRHARTHTAELVVGAALLAQEQGNS
jgi:Na+-transporting methylmalonyl-CoA/oxaloacetate decarboxylase gamma subunit